MAAACHLSTSRFLHRFTEKAGRTFRTVLGQMLATEARRLLAGTDWPMGRIARVLGHRNQNRFSASFRRDTGQTPTGFRRESRRPQGA